MYNGKELAFERKKMSLYIIVNFRLNILVEQQIPTFGGTWFLTGRHTSIII